MKHKKSLIYGMNEAILNLQQGNGSLSKINKMQIMT